MVSRLDDIYGSGNNVIDSYSLTRERFDTAEEAAVYSRKHGGNARDRREQRCIRRALEACDLPLDARVIDFPCGTGRLSPLIVDMGFRLIGADSSPHMVQQAMDAWERQVSEHRARIGKASFEVRDVMASGYADGEFDAVICNRLLHHFTDSGTRVTALTELRRISKRWVIASFFNAHALDALKVRVGLFLVGKQKTKRVPITMAQFEADAKKAGLKMVRSLPTRGRISPQWYVLFERMDHAPSAD